jgi:RNA polymerase sigma-70 factor, ECF subfamily
MRETVALDVDAAYRSHRTAVVATAARILGDRDAAEDIAQDVFAGLWTHPERHDAARGSVQTYLVLLARHRALDALRRQAARERAHAALAGEVDERAEDDAETRVMRSERAGVVRRALPRLAPEQREALFLRYWGGLSDAGIAAQTSAPLGTVKGRLRLAGAALRPLLQPAAEVR